MTEQTRNTQKPRTEGSVEIYSQEKKLISTDRQNVEDEVQGKKQMEASEAEAQPLKRR